MKIKRVLLIITILFLTAACSSTSANLPSTPLVSNTPENIGTNTPLLSDHTPTPTYLEKWWVTPFTPEPTLAYEVQDEFYRLLETNGGCELPCFLGIVPDETTIEEVRFLLDKYSETGDISFHENYSTEEEKSYTLVFRMTKDVYLQIYLDLITSKDIVEKMTIYTNASIDGSYAVYDQHLARYSLREIFQHQGPPDIIYIIPPDISINMRAYGIEVIYEDAKIMFTLPGGARKNDQGGYRICPNIGEGDIGTSNFTLLSASNPTDIKTLSLIDFGGDELWFPIEEVLGISIEEFYNRILMETPACFDI